MVIVVGAGPAGSIAARTLALAGVPVTLLERAPEFPRNKPCGGGMSIRVLRRFPWLESALTAIDTLRLSRLYLEGPDNTSITITSDEPAVLMIRRVEFDAVLVRQAIDAGAALVTGADVVRASQDDEGVTLESRDGRRFRAAVVIAADGVHSIVARRLGLNPGWPATSVALDMMEETPVNVLDADRSTLWVSYGYTPANASCSANGERIDETTGRRGHPHMRLEPGDGRRSAAGYAYIFPKRNHVNVGIGYVLEHFRREISEKPIEVQAGFVRHLRDRGLARGHSEPANFTPFIIPVGGPLARTGDRRVLLAGDAGGFVNGFTAEGIYYAMVSGELAARTVLNTSARAVAGGELARYYRQACDREFGAELTDSVRIQRFLFADRRRIGRVIRAAQRSSVQTRIVLDYAMGRISYRTARRRFVVRSPLAALQLLVAQRSTAAGATS